MRCASCGLSFRPKFFMKKVNKLWHKHRNLSHLKSKRNLSQSRLPQVIVGTLSYHTTHAYINVPAFYCCFWLTVADGYDDGDDDDESADAACKCGGDYVSSTTFWLLMPLAIMQSTSEAPGG